MNDAMFSIVENIKNPKQLAVRARFKGDIERVFLVPTRKVVVDGGTDYKYRIMLPRKKEMKTISSEIEDIDYTNFKDSVVEDWRAKLYGRVWTLFFGEQEARNPLKEAWYNSYRAQRGYEQYATYAGPKSAMASAQVFEEIEDDEEDDDDYLRMNDFEYEVLEDVYGPNERDAHEEFLSRYRGFSSVDL